MNKEIECKTHPNAPHGFVRNASHTEDRYVCECEYWEEPKVNERIKELADEAEEYAARVTTGDWEVGLAYQDLFNKKFAELIVAECVGVVEGGSFLHDQAPTAIFARECSSAIKLHFGVEE